MPSPHIVKARTPKAGPGAQAPHMDIDLTQRQEALVEFIEDHPCCGIFAGMGSGKTAVVLAALDRIRPSGPMLVIAPPAIARSTWLDEAAKWNFGAPVVSLMRDENDRMLPKARRHERYNRVFTDPPALYVLNDTLVEDFVAAMPAGRRDTRRFIRWPFPTVIIDESQSFKNPSSHRFRALKRVRPGMRRVICLSGTPMPNGYLDLYAQVWLMDMGRRLGTSFTKYRERWFTPRQYVNGNIPIGWTPRPGAPADIDSRVSDIVVHSDVDLDIPPMDVTDTWVTMDDKATKMYRTLERDTVLGLVGPDGTHSIEGGTAAVLRARLLQLASGTSYVDGTREFAVIHDAKLDALEDIVRNADGPVIVAYRYRCDQGRILKRLEPYGARAFDGSRAMVAGWNARKIPVMLIHPQSAGHGLNLQYGGHTLVWYTLPDSLEQYEQANKRLHRPGQKKPVTIHRLLTKGTWDGVMPRLLGKKAMTQSAFLAAQDAQLAQYVEKIREEKDV